MPSYDGTIMQYNLTEHNWRTVDNSASDRFELIARVILISVQFPEAVFAIAHVDEFVEIWRKGERVELYMKG
jgi:hypothetical protein